MQKKIRSLVSSLSIVLTSCSFNHFLKNEFIFPVVRMSSPYAVRRVKVPSGGGTLAPKMPMYNEKSHRQICKKLNTGILT